MKKNKVDTLELSEVKWIVKWYFRYGEYRCVLSGGKIKVNEVYIPLKNGATPIIKVEWINEMLIMFQLKIILVDMMLQPHIPITDHEYENVKWIYKQTEDILRQDNKIKLIAV